MRISVVGAERRIVLSGRLRRWRRRGEYRVVKLPDVLLQVEITTEALPTDLASELQTCKKVAMKSYCYYKSSCEPLN